MNENDIEMGELSSEASQGVVNANPGFEAIADETPSEDLMALAISALLENDENGEMEDLLSNLF